ncbi:MAG TPA: OmpA family protein [Polyangiaceae bacterium]|jgi:outer membrane protein OmpA-like peptidoglycan-associated protein
MKLAVIALTSLTLASVAAIVTGCATAPPPETAAVEPARPVVHTTSAALPSPEAALARVAVVRNEPRGMVVTLPISTLFEPGESTILPGARDKLDRIARALRREGADASFEVEARTLAGDTDISVKRAAAVRTYLDARGIPADRILAEGLAPDGENADVQIVVHTPPTSSSASSFPSAAPR